jgi:prevent-host-death family protein
MSSMVSATQARIHFGELMRRVVEEQEPIIVERDGKPHIVLLSISEYERLQAGRQREGWDKALERAIQIGARIKARRGGQPITPPEEVIRQVREERDGQFPNLR